MAQLGDPRHVRTRANGLHGAYTREITYAYGAIELGPPRRFGSLGADACPFRCGLGDRLGSALLPPEQRWSTSAIFRPRRQRP